MPEPLEEKVLALLVCDMPTLVCEERDIVDDLYSSFGGSQFETVQSPEGTNPLTGIWEYSVETDGREDYLILMTFWAGEDRYGAAIWLNGVPLHDPRNRERGLPSSLRTPEAYWYQWAPSRTP